MLPLIFIHGYGQSARCWQTTPDGQEGFNDMFRAKRYATYLVDLPGRGRAGRTTAETAIQALADEQFWFDIFRIGEWPAFNQGVQFPTDKDSLDQFFRQMTPDIGTHDMKAHSPHIYFLRPPSVIMVAKPVIRLSTGREPFMIEWELFEEAKYMP